MNFYPIFWKEMMLIRKKPWRFLASSMVMPVLYFVTFGWGLGRGINVGGGKHLDFVLPGILARARLFHEWQSQTGAASGLVRILRPHTSHLVIYRILLYPVYHMEDPVLSFACHVLVWYNVAMGVVSVTPR